MQKQSRIKEFYNHLLGSYSRQKWWPADSRLECVLGAILTQNTSWKNAEKAIENLKKKDLINIQKLKKIGLSELAETIRPSGYYNQKAKKIKYFIEYFSENYGSFEKMMEKDMNVLRYELLSLNGIGPETADTILLYALEKPSFVVDKYTYRLLNRHGLVPEHTTYQEMQELMVNNIEVNTGIYNEFHALIVKVGKNHCRNRALCEGCPLEYDLA